MFEPSDAQRSEPGACHAMDKVRKRNQAKPRSAVTSNPKGKTPTTTTREVRVNWKALTLVVVGLILIVPGILGLKAWQDRNGRSTLLGEARKQRDVAKRPDLALGYFNRYLELAPDDLDALDQRSRLLAETAREPTALATAIQAHVALLGKPPGGPPRGPARKRLAELYLRSAQFRAAEQAARDYLRLDDANDASIHRLLARSLEGSGRLGDVKALEAAVAEYEAAEAIKPGDVASAERLAVLYFDKFADRAKATQVLDTLLKHHPNSTEARLARSRYFAETGDIQASTAEIEAALRLDSKDVATRLTAAEAATRRGDPGAARLHLAAIQPPRPDDIRVKIIEGLIELDDRKTDEAIKNWRAGLILAGGSDAELTWRLAHVLIQLGRVREAEPLLSQYRRLTGGEEPPAAYRYLVGLAFLKSGRIADAITELEAIRYKLDKGLEGQLYLALGQAYETSQEPTKAADAYTRSSNATGAGSAPWLALARLQANSRPGEELATLERGIATIGPDAQLLGELARAQWRKQFVLPKEKRNWADLDQVLEQGKKVAPESVELALVQADYRASLGRQEDGLALLEAATKQVPNSMALWMAQIESLARLGRIDEAIERLDRATASAGEQASFRIARARYALRKGEVKVARAALVEGLDRVPTEQKPALCKALGEFHQTQGDRAASRLAFLQWATLRPDAIDPHLALLNLAIEAGDLRSIDAEVDALKAIGGPRSIYWKIARAEGLLYQRTGVALPAANLEEAARLVEEIKTSTPRQPAGLLLEARLMEYQGRHDSAIGAYEKALDLKAGTLALKPMVALLARLGRYDELESLRTRVGGFPPEVERMAGALVLRQGTPEKAEELARRMVAGDPLGLDARVWQARVLGELGKTDEAERSIRQLVDRRPDLAAPWVQLLMFQVSRKDFAKASATIEQMKARVKADRPELLWALCYRVANLRSQADPAFAEALRAHPDEIPTLQSAIDYYEATGRPERAEPLLRRALKVNPGLDWVRRRLALNLAGRPGNPDSWQESLRLAGEGSDGSDMPDDRLTRAVVLSLGPEPRRREAVAILEKLAVEMPESARIQESLARALLGIGETSKAREHATRAAAGVTPSPESIRLAVALDLTVKDVDAATRHLARLDATGSDDSSTLELRARVLKAQGKPKEAVASLEKAFENARRSPGALDFGRALIRLMTALDEPEAAERMARKAAELGASGPITLAEFLGSRGRFDEALVVYESVARDRSTAKDAARSALALASMTHDTRWCDLADRLIDRATTIEPDDTELAYARASLRHLQGKLEEAVKLYDELAARAPANLLFLNNCAWILSEELGRPLEGLQRIEALIAKSGGQPHTLDTRGVIQLRLGRNDLAIRDLETAAGSIPSGPICYHLARAYIAAGRPDDAAKTLAKAKAAGLNADQLQPTERNELSRIMASLK
jgi:tetratricopeptide (TPR) repeat protein